MRKQDGNYTQVGGKADGRQDGRAVRTSAAGAARMRHGPRGRRQRGVLSLLTGR